MEEKKYTEAVEAFLDDVYRLSLSITGSEADAADVSLEVFVRLSQTRKRFESRDHLKNWLLKSAANESKSFLRSYWRRHAGSLDQLESEPAELTHQSEVSQAYDELHQVLAILSRTDRAIVHLYYWEEIDQKQIAKILSLSQSNVSTRLSRARQKMKKMLSQAENEQEKQNDRKQKIQQA